MKKTNDDYMDDGDYGDTYDRDGTKYADTYYRGVISHGALTAYLSDKTGAIPELDILTEGLGIPLARIDDYVVRWLALAMRELGYLPRREYVEIGSQRVPVRVLWTKIVKPPMTGQA